MTDAVTVAVHDGVHLATFDDGKANALTHDALGALREAVAGAVDAGTALVLAGRAGRFCAGFDVAVARSGNRDALGALFDAGGSLFLDLLAAPVPVIAACTGHALAGGALLLLTADWRVAADGAFRIGFNEVEIGLPLPTAAISVARERLAPSHLTRATALAEVFDPAGARAAGFVDEVVGARSVVDVALGAAARLSALDASAFAATKRRLRRPLVEQVRALAARPR